MINKSKKGAHDTGALVMGQILLQYALNDDIGLSTVCILENLYSASPKTFKRKAYALIKHLESSKSKYSFIDVSSVSESVIKYVNMTSALSASDTVEYKHVFEDCDEMEQNHQGSGPVSDGSKDMVALWTRASADIRGSTEFPAHLFEKMRKMFGSDYSDIEGVNVFVDDFKKCVLSMVVDFNGRYKESRRQMYYILEQVIDRGPYRKHISDYDIKGLREMKSKFPNFTDVVSFYDGALALHSKLNTNASLDPVLLIGEPGTGKTLFSQDLSMVLRSKLFIESMDSPDISHSIIGTDKHWSNSSYGRIFSSIVLGEHINPVIILDEIDKAYKFSKSGADVFHSILEEKTAAIFKDKCVDYPIDASWITWIATANEEHDIPGSILNRFQVFHIKPLTVDQKRYIIHDKVLSIGNGVFSMDDETVEMMTKMDMRTMQRSIKNSMGSAALRGSVVINISDLTVDVADMHKQAKIGFIQ